MFVLFDKQAGHIGERLLTGTVLWDRFRKCWRKLIDLGLNKGRGWFLNFSKAPLIFSWKWNIFFPVNAKITPTAYVFWLILYLGSRQAFCSNAVSFYEQPVRGNICVSQEEQSSEHRENCSSLSDCYLHISKYHLAHRKPSTSFHRVECAETTPIFFAWYQYFRRFGIIRCNRQAALH